MDVWFISPLMVANSPTMRCGKTTLLQIVAQLVSRALATSNITPAALFRAIEKYRPTLILDEAETFLKDNEDLRGLVNAGHTKNTAVVIRTVGESHEAAAFSTWCAKFLALIGRLPGTLMDRAIVIPMRRRLAGEAVERLRLDQLEPRCSPLQRQAVRWIADHADALRLADPDMPKALGDRAADNWRSLVAIADAAGDEWPARARATAVLVSGESDEDDATARLLSDIRDIFRADGDVDVLASSVIVERLVALEDRPWAEWSHGRPLSTAKLARMLAAFGVHPAGTIRIGPKTAKGYRRAAFVDAWDRYLPAEESSEVSHGNRTNVSGLTAAFSKGHTENERDALRSVTTRTDPRPKNGVTHRLHRTGDPRSADDGGDDAGLF
jgi:putative DNA primase/helicase